MTIQPFTEFSTMTINVTTARKVQGKHILNFQLSQILFFFHMDGKQLFYGFNYPFGTQWLDKRESHIHLHFFNLDPSVQLSPYLVTVPSNESHF